MENLSQWFKKTVICVLVFQLSGCGTLLYPERRQQKSGRLDAGVVILDAVGLLFFILPGIIAFAVDFSTGCIYVPAENPKTSFREIKFDPKHTTMAQIERTIKDQTGHTLKLTQSDMRVIKLSSKKEMVQMFAQIIPNDRLAMNPYDQRI